MSKKTYYIPDMIKNNEYINTIDNNILNSEKNSFNIGIPSTHITNLENDLILSKNINERINKLPKIYIDKDGCVIIEGDIKIKVKGRIFLYSDDHIIIDSGKDGKNIYLNSSEEKNFKVPEKK